MEKDIHKLEKEVNELKYKNSELLKSKNQHENITKNLRKQIAELNTVDLKIFLLINQHAFVYQNFSKF